LFQVVVAALALSPIPAIRVA
ncbi:hypothetical protein D030_2478B, partial [Vibrio parahaemolyticus AQ3810]